MCHVTVGIYSHGLTDFLEDREKLIFKSAVTFWRTVEKSFPRVKN